MATARALARLNPMDGRRSEADLRRSRRERAPTRMRQIFLATRLVRRGCAGSGRGPAAMSSTVIGPSAGAIDAEFLQRADRRSALFSFKTFENLGACGSAFAALIKQHYRHASTETVLRYFVPMMRQ